MADSLTRYREHYVRGYVGFNLTGSPFVDVGIPSLYETGTLPYIFKNPATLYSYEYTDERGVIHNEYTSGGIIAKKSWFRIRLVAKWDAIEIGTYNGGRVTTPSDYEMLVMMKRNREKFSGNGGTNLMLRLNTMIDIDGTVSGGWDNVSFQELDIQVVPISIEFSDLPANRFVQYRGATAVFESIYLRQHPYSFVPSRPI